MQRVAILRPVAVRAASERTKEVLQTVELELFALACLQGVTFLGKADLDQARQRAGAHRYATMLLPEQPRHCIVACRCRERHHGKLEWGTHLLLAQRGEVFRQRRRRLPALQFQPERLPLTGQVAEFQCECRFRHDNL